MKTTCQLLGKEEDARKIKIYDITKDDLAWKIPYARHANKKMTPPESLSPLDIYKRGEHTKNHVSDYGVDQNSHPLTESNLPFSTTQVFP